MKKTILLRLVFVSLLLVGAESSAENPSTAVFPHLRVELFAEQHADNATVPARVGVRFIIEPGWHIYGKEPGDVGLPTTVKWKLPAGYSSGDLLWPEPKEFHADGVTSRGYENTVVVLSDIHEESKNGLSSKLEAEADVRWVLCKDECIPGHARLATNVPVSAAARNVAPRQRAFQAVKSLRPREGTIIVASDRRSSRNNAAL